MAQLVAHLHGMQGVRGSNPLSSTERTGQRPCPNLERGAGHGHWPFIGHLSGVPGPETARSRVVSTSLGGPRPPRCHGHHTHITHTTRDALEPVFTITELATQLSVSTQALYDLRSKGRGPTFFRVGRQLRFRQSEIDAWLARLEGEDHHRHHPGDAR